MSDGVVNRRVPGSNPGQHTKEGNMGYIDDEDYDGWQGEMYMANLFRGIGAVAAMLCPSPNERLMALIPPGCNTTTYYNNFHQVDGSGSNAKVRWRDGHPYYAALNLEILGQSVNFNTGCGNAPLGSVYLFFEALGRYYGKKKKA